ncbi:MAG: CDP-alcohol phosphatidyltransferase family protein [Ignavibacteriales bacterium]|nr:CDP-alcohol phosphatidyltransferase family protein [Ignavibacteriales bacterium]
MAGRIWTISNSISAFRVALVIPLGITLLGESETDRTWAVVIIVAGILSDFLDGYLARALHQVSEVGKVIDPIADKIGIGALVVFLVLLEDIPLWYALVVLVRDLLIVIGGVYIKKKKKIVAQSNWPGKIAVGMVAAYLLLSVPRLENLEMLRLLALWLSLVTMGFSLVVYAQRLLIGRAVDRRI